MDTYNFTQARTRLKDLLDQVANGETVGIRRHGLVVGVVVPAAEYEALTQGERPSPGLTLDDIRQVVRQELGRDVAMRDRDDPEYLPMWLEPYRHLLGRVPDVDVAKVAHNTGNAVSIWRTKLGIPSWKSQGKPAGPRNPDRRPPWLTSQVEAKMGTMPDRELAAEVGKSIQTIGNWRNALGIERWR